MIGNKLQSLLITIVVNTDRHIEAFTLRRLYVYVTTEC